MNRMSQLRELAATICAAAIVGLATFILVGKPADLLASRNHEWLIGLMAFTLLATGLDHLFAWAAKLRLQPILISQELRDWQK